MHIWSLALTVKHWDRGEKNGLLVTNRGRYLQVHLALLPLASYSECKISASIVFTPHLKIFTFQQGASMLAKQPQEAQKYSVFLHILQWTYTSTSSTSAASTLPPPTTPDSNKIWYDLKTSPQGSSVHSHMTKKTRQNFTLLPSRVVPADSSS